VPLRSSSALRLVLLLGGLASLLSPPLPSQTASPTAQPVAGGGSVFQANARIVVLDVVVSGKNRRPLTGLHKQDFVLSEDGHPQTITFFEEHSSAQPLPANQETPPDLPPNVFTNIPRVKSGDPVTVLVLDSLNTPLDDQRFVRAQMLKYLKKLEPGRRIAIFILGTQLRLLQGFTDDPALLLAAINERKNGSGAQISPLLQSTAETAATQETIGALMQYAPDAAADMKQFAAEEGATRSDVRIKLTLQAFQQLAQYLAGIPGRKNVAWFSGAFPVALFPDPSLPDRFGAERDDQAEIHKTDALLASAQVAIYPIGAEGVGTDTLYTAGADSRLTQQQISQPQQQTQERNANHAAMDVIAKDTGGAAFYGTNSLTDAMEGVTAHGSNFYTLTYTSTNPATDGKFRKIQVQLANSRGYQLAYRRGYYVDDAKSVQAAAATPAPKPAADPLSSFLRPGLPQSTQIPFTLQVTRRSAPAKTSPASIAAKPVAGIPGQGGDNPNLQGALTRYSVDLMIPAHGLQFEMASDGHHHVSVEAALVVYDRRGKPLNWMLRQINLNMDAARYAIAQKSGVNFFLVIDAPEDGSSLRSGVYDLNAILAGTLEIPLSTIVTPATTTSSK
jgi:VWFA-related protein